MRHHRPRRHHRSRNNGRGFKRNGSSGTEFIRNGVSQDMNSRRIFRGNQNASKLLEKYLNLGKEALSSGDKILSENYFQHADHFSRIVESKKEILLTCGISRNSSKRFFPTIPRPIMPTLILI